jgi:hypothetical protein
LDLERTATVHDSSQDDARSQLLAFLNALAANQQQNGAPAELGVIA